MGVGNFIHLLGSFDRLLNLQSKHGKAIEKLESEIAGLKAHVTRLESREEVVVSDARAAASVAATQVAIASVTDVARRIGVLEERSEPKRLGRPR